MRLVLFDADGGSRPSPLRSTASRPAFSETLDTHCNFNLCWFGSSAVGNERLRPEKADDRRVLLEVRGGAARGLKTQSHRPLRAFETQSPFPVRLLVLMTCSEHLRRVRTLSGNCQSAAPSSSSPGFFEADEDENVFQVLHSLNLVGWVRRRVEDSSLANAALLLPIHRPEIVGCWRQDKKTDPHAFRRRSRVMRKGNPAKTIEAQTSSALSQLAERREERGLRPSVESGCCLDTSARRRESLKEETAFSTRLPRRPLASFASPERGSGRRRIFSLQQRLAASVGLLFFLQAGGRLTAGECLTVRRSLSTAFTHQGLEGLPRVSSLWPNREEASGLEDRRGRLLPRTAESDAESPRALGLCRIRLKQKGWKSSARMAQATEKEGVSSEEASLALEAAVSEADVTAPQSVLSEKASSPHSFVRLDRSAFSYELAVPYLRLPVDQIQKFSRAFRK